MVLGKCRGTVGPGAKLVIPGICEVIRVPVVPEVYATSLQSVTLHDGTILTFSASVTVVVRDPRRAYLELGHHTETVQEIAAAVLAQAMADSDPAEVTATREARSDFLRRLRQEINDVTVPYGLEVTALRVNNYVLGVRTLRLLLDRAVLPQIASGI
jgi:regulator of protease activity HflC (stomatin/prohibitin superfamily)